MKGTRPGDSHLQSSLHHLAHKQLFFYDLTGKIRLSFQRLAVQRTVTEHTQFSDNCIQISRFRSEIYSERLEKVTPIQFFGTEGLLS